MLCRDSYSYFNQAAPQTAKSSYTTIFVIEIKMGGFKDFI